MKNYNFSILLFVFFGLISNSFANDADISSLKKQIKAEEERIITEATGFVYLFHFTGIVKNKKKDIERIKKENDYSLFAKEDEKIKKLSSRLATLKLLDGRASSDKDLKDLSEFLDKSYALSTDRERKQIYQSDTLEAISDLSKSSSR